MAACGTELKSGGGFLTSRIPQHIRKVLKPILKLMKRKQSSKRLQSAAEGERREESFCGDDVKDAVANDNAANEALEARLRESLFPTTLGGDRVRIVVPASGALGWAPSPDRDIWWRDEQPISGYQHPEQQSPVHCKCSHYAPRRFSFDQDRCAEYY